MKTMSKIAATTLATLGLAGSVYAATGPATPPAPHGDHLRGPMMGMPGPFAGGGFLAALRQLNLTDQQKQSIKGILGTARDQFQPLLTAADITAISNPGDPNYAQAVRDAQAAASKRIEQFSGIEQQIYNLLTPAQKTQLPTVLADMKTKREEHRADKQQKHGQSSSSSSKSVL